MFFHFHAEILIEIELRKCSNSLQNSGTLIIVNGTRDLYTKNYLSVGRTGVEPTIDGDLCEIELDLIDCRIKDYFWSEKFIIEKAERGGFKLVGLHYPLGKVGDKQQYKDENFHLIIFWHLKKYEQK